MVKKTNKKNKKKAKNEEESNHTQEDINSNKNNNNQTKSKIIFKDIDYKKFSKSIEKELTRKITSSPNELDFLKFEENEGSGESIYTKIHNNYLKNSLNINIISMINQLINTSTTIPKKLKNEYPIHNILLDITKELMLTDLEIVYYSLYLDNFGWTNDYYDVKDNLVITALSVKKYLNQDIDIIENHLNKNYEKLEEKFDNWIKLQKNFQKNISIPPTQVNERNTLLKKPFNCYCRNNYIDYNDAVDKILKWSPSYNEINKYSKKNNFKTKNAIGTHEVDLTYGIEENNNDNYNEINKNLNSNIQQNNNININSNENNNFKNKLSGFFNFNLNSNINSNINLMRADSKDNFGFPNIHNSNEFENLNDSKKYNKKDSLYLQRQFSNFDDMY